MSEVLTADELRVAEALLALGRVNPFLAARKEHEQAALGEAFVPGGAVWSLGDEGGDDPNADRIVPVAEALGEVMRRRLERQRASPHERELYAGVVFMVLYNRYVGAIPASSSADPTPVVADYDRYLADFRRYFRVCAPPDPEVDTPAHLFACFWQIHRAFDRIFSSIVGGSMPAARLRAATWQSIFSFDAGRYRRFLYRTMADIPTLITGPTGTGKELVARAIGLAGYVPFDEERRRFAHPPSFLALNPSALPPALLESELFGHRRGAFTGAVADREGWLSLCPRGGTVFLDEIGDLEPMLQVKLLRVLEDRTFSPVGDTRVLQFTGKLVAATNRDLPAAITAGTFRADLYYRLCGDRVVTPSLRERLDADGEELRRVLGALVARVVPPLHAEAVADEVAREVSRSRGEDWPWPGNVRELAQCARNVLVQGTCGPAEAMPDGAEPGFGDGSRPLAEITRRYVRLVYQRHRTYKAAADVLGIDWRTVRAQVG
jgi:hypothetical protein